MNENRNFIIILAACGLVAVLIGCGICVVGGFGAYFLTAPVAENVTFPTLEVNIPTAPARPTVGVLPGGPVAPSEAAPTAVNTGPGSPPGGPPSSQPGSPMLAPALETLKTFDEEVVPINDPIELAERLEGRTGLARELKTPVKTYQVSDRDKFWVTNSDTNDSVQVDATLRYITDHVYFWVQDGVSYNQRELRDLVETFESKIYPRDREFFGSEWTPGVDADPHLYILYAHGLGGSVAGYYSSADEYLPVVREKTNGHEMFLLSADHVALGEEYAYGVLAHEFQHMIHWYRDRNEETWMNEGFSDLAMFLNGYSIGGADHAYTDNPDIQLNDWPTTPENRTAHYGGAFLFLAYYLDRFGEQATQNLVTAEANGMASIDQVLADLGAVDDQTGQAVGADDLFADWAIASYLQDENVGDGRYAYHNYSQAPSPSATEDLEDCSEAPLARDVSQYGVDYIRLRCSGDVTLRFEGSQWVNALPADPHSGSYAFYSNRGDESDMALTRTFDLTDASGSLTLTYWTWYDLEQDYDYLYLTASTDGKNWQILTTPDGTADDPVGNSYGWAYNGMSGGGPEWIEQKVDISQYAGKELQVRFEYVTDAAVNGEGFVLDDVSIPEISYSTDFESDDGGWQADGFVRIQNVLPQTFRLSVIRAGGDTQVDKIVVPAEGVVEIPLSFDRSTGEVILVISGTTRFTRQTAAYQISFLPR